MIGWCFEFHANVCQQLVSESGVEQEIVVPYDEPVMTALEDFSEKVLMAERNWEGRMCVSYSLAHGIFIIGFRTTKN